jgi:hypothetical protein
MLFLRGSLGRSETEARRQMSMVSPDFQFPDRAENMLHSCR